MRARVGRGDRHRADYGGRTRRLLVGSQASLRWGLIHEGEIREPVLAGCRRAPFPSQGKRRARGSNPRGTLAPATAFETDAFTLCQPSSERTGIDTDVCTSESMTGHLVHG